MSSISLKDHKFSLLGKIYVWSVVIDPLLFFVVFQSIFSGVGGNLSRLLQLIVIIVLLIRVILNFPQSLKIPNPFHSKYSWYFVYFILSIISGVFGLLYGSYQTIYDEIYLAGNFTYFSYFINNFGVRPFFEYFIILYYFVYFAILPSYLLFNEKGIRYFFTVFVGMFFLSFGVGVIDFAIEYIYGYQWIPKHIFRWSTDPLHVGLRFHGLAGEPRDAFVYLIFGTGILFLRDQWFDIQRLNIFWIILFIIAMMLTESLSGILGAVMAFFLILFFLIPKIPLKQIFLVLLGIVLGSLAIYVLLENSVRITLFIRELPGFILAIEDKGHLPPIYQLQASNIYPILLRIKEVLNFNLLPLIIGTGLGSASVATSQFIKEAIVANPNANIVRLIFENGIIGTMVFVFAFIHPLRRLNVSKLKLKYLLLFMLLILGAFFGHRSSTLYTFLGIAIVIFSYKQNVQVKMNSNKLIN